MFRHVTIRVSDRSVSERFYRATLGELGIEPTHAGQDLVAWNDFAIVAADSEHQPTRSLHVAFVAPTRELVDEFWRAGLRSGGKDDGEPGERPQYTSSYYGAFLRDPDGNSAEAVIHSDVRRGGHIDHLWIRVRNVDAAAAFYATVAPHTGLREGRRWENGRQFRGAWATSSLVADGTPPTENLHIAFPAPDQLTVEDFQAPPPRPATATTALRARGRTTTRATTAPTYSTKTARTSSRSSTSEVSEIPGGGSPGPGRSRIGPQPHPSHDKRPLRRDRRGAGSARLVARWLPGIPCRPRSG